MTSITQPTDQTTDRTTDRRISVDLDIEGMTCASCAARIEKRLGKLDGVSASVNYATNRALVLAPTGVTAADLVAAVEKAGYGASVHEPDAPEPPDPAEGIRRRLVVAGALAVPVIAMAMVPPLQFPGWQWVSLVLATPIVTWAAWPFHRSALVNARHGATTMDTLISLGTTAAYLWSVYAMLFGHAGRIGLKHAFEFTLSRHDATMNIYFEAAAGIIAFILLGRWFEARSRRDAGAAIRTLLALGAKEVTVVRDGVEETVPAESLVVGDEFVVRPGEKVATDGVVVSGASAIDAALVTGESVPVDVSPGSAVVGATVNTTGRLVVRATRVGSETQLAQMARLVEEAQTGKAAVQRLADRVSAIFVPIVLALAAVTAVGWLVAGETLGFALTAAVAVLIIACPCALGLATPTALLVGTGRGAQLGIIIRGPEVLESTRQVDTIVLDKTGTITTGTMSVVDVVVAGGEAQDTVVRAAASVERGSEHPISKAIASLRPDSTVADGVTNVPGRGVTGTVDLGGATEVVVGSPVFMTDRRIDLPNDLADALGVAQAQGRTAVVVAWNGRARGVISVADEPRPTAAKAVAAYRELGLEPILLSGDHEAAARAAAGAVGITTVIAGVGPADKVAEVRRLQEAGRTVAMVGDGVNDAGALAQADLGVAMGSGTDAAIAASDLTLMRSDPVAAADAIRLSRATLRTIKSNLFWAFAYNVAALPIAALGLLNPMVAGAAMAFSSVFVVSNSLRLRGFRPLR
jgi:Cu+-exporting ATPase